MFALGLIIGLVAGAGTVGIIWFATTRGSKIVQTGVDKASEKIAQQ